MPVLAAGIAPEGTSRIAACCTRWGRSGYWLGASILGQLGGLAAGVERWVEVSDLDRYEPLMKLRNCRTT